MTIIDKVRSAFEGHLVFTSNEVKDIVVKAFPGTNRDSVIPSDYCYNRINNDKSVLKFNFHLFEYLGRNRYRYMGEGCRYTGTIYWRNEKVGEWVDGKPVFDESLMK